MYTAWMIILRDYFKLLEKKEVKFEIVLPVVISICYPCNHVHSESVVAFEPHSLSRMLSTLYYHRLYTRTYVWYNIFSD